MPFAFQVARSAAPSGLGSQEGLATKNPQRALCFYGYDKNFVMVRKFLNFGGCLWVELEK